ATQCHALPRNPRPPPPSQRKQVAGSGISEGRGARSRFELVKALRRNIHPVLFPGIFFTGQLEGLQSRPFPRESPARWPGCAVTPRRTSKSQLICYLMRSKLRPQVTGPGAHAANGFSGGTNNGPLRAGDAAKGPIPHSAGL